MSLPTTPPARARISLRERNRLTTRDTIADAAMHLAMRHGLGEVRIEDIAAEAGVSQRTFSNYFANKYEALTTRHVERMHHAAEALRARPAAEPLWTAICNAVLAPWHAVQDQLATPTPSVLAELRLLFGDRNVQSEILRSGIAQDNDFARAVAERAGLEAGDLYPRIVAAAITAVTQVVLDSFLRADPPVPLTPLLSKALQDLAAGLPEPASPTAEAREPGRAG